MSGFVFILNQDGEKVSEPLLSELVDTIKMKGPDRQSTHTDNNIGFGHTLFKTTFEAEYDKQPASLDEKIWIVSSARIDGRDDLVKNLEMSKKINLDTTPDYELILFAYRKWGEECTKYLIGDFAFVIWDEQRDKVFCARDRFGMNQLYYAFENNTLIVSNSLYCMQKHPKISKQLNDRAVGGFLLFGDHTWMDRSITMFKDINVLEPSHQFIFHKNKINIKRYWDIPQDIPLLKYKNEGDYVEHFMDIFKTAVEDRIRTSSIVVSMSGGMDSTAVAAMAKSIKEEGKKPDFTLNAVTRVFDELIACDERHYATLAADKLKIPIHYFKDDGYQLLKPYHATSRPVQLLTPDNLLEAEKYIAQMSRVRLTGISADNLLHYASGKSAYHEVGLFSFAVNYRYLKKLYGEKLPLGTGLKSKFSFRKKTADISYPQWLNPDFEIDEDLKEIWESSILDEKTLLHYRHPNAYKSLMYPEWNTDDLIYNSSFTLPEQRDPFLDTRLIEFIFSLPPLPWLWNKHLLRSAMKDVLPAEIINRPKTPLGDIRGALLNKEESKWVDELEMLPELHTYIELDKIPRLTTQNIDPTLLHIGLRPIILNLWMQEI